MKKAFVFAFAMAALAAGTQAVKHTATQSGSPALLASGGSNCPVYYGCPVSPTPAPKGGGNSGGGNSGGGNSGGGVDNTAPHA